MRRKRNWLWYLSLFAVPAAAVTVGVRYYSKHNLSDSKTGWSAIDRSDSKQSKADLGSGAWKDSKHFIDDVAKKADEKTDAAPVKPASEAVAAAPSAPHPAFAPDQELCSSMEFRGEGPAVAQYTEEEWVALRAEFRKVKKDMLVWLEGNREKFAPSTAAFMENQLKHLSIHRPPVAAQPDISWRGIGVWAHLEDEQPTIMVGGGFMKLAKAQPARVRFEIARLVAQSWAPCELKRAGVEKSLETWKPLLSCLGVSEAQRGLASASETAPSDQSCASGSYSEAGWAFATTLAAKISPPGCLIPAFKDPSVAECGRKFPLEGGVQ